MYIWEILCQIYPIAIIMGFISIPLLYIWFNEESEYEPLDDYYSKEDKSDESNI